MTAEPRCWGGGGGVSHPSQLTTGLVIKSVTTSPTFGRSYAFYSQVSILSEQMKFWQNTFFLILTKNEAYSHLPISFHSKTNFKILMLYRPLAYPISAKTRDRGEVFLTNR